MRNRISNEIQPNRDRKGVGCCVLRRAEKLRAALRFARAQPNRDREGVGYRALRKARVVPAMRGQEEFRAALRFARATKERANR
jgi:hypothetical protein